MKTILIVEDNSKLAAFYASILDKASFKTFTAYNSEEFLGQYRQARPDLIILDIRLHNSELSGLEIFQKLVDNNPYNSKVIILSGEATRSEIAQAMQLGAYTFIEKRGEFNIDKFLSDIRQAINLKEQEENNISLRRDYEALRSKLIETQPLIGDSAPLQKLKERITKFAKADVDILIVGETGTGKEVVANNLYWQSSRVGKPFIKVNAGGLTESLIDSELFGHKKGAFTNAYSDKKGVFEEADGGVLLLDEIANLTLPIQAKILRAIENKEIKVIGGKTLNVDVRLFFACNKELQNLISNEQFRSDLYYRLEGNIIAIPPLRERGEDVILLMDYFLKAYSTKYNCLLDVNLNKLKASLLAYNWPGNVRELEKFCENIFVLHKIVDNQIILEEFENKQHGKTGEKSGTLDEIITIGDYQTAFESFEKKYLIRQLQKHHYKVPELSDNLGLDRSTVYKKLKKYGIEF